MPDGVNLSATIWLPDDAEKNPVPAVLEFIPYRRRDFTAAGDALHHPYIAGQGYAAVRCDIRGNGDSEGLFDDEYSKQELDDGYHVLEWLAKQSWCSGNTGMMGISWGGFNCLQVAALRPPSLKAIYSVCSTDDRYADDIHYMGGCLLNENLSWGGTMSTFAMRPPDPEVVGDRWYDMWLQRLENAPNLVAKWMSHQMRDQQWTHGSVCENYDSIQAAVYAVGGWADGYTNTVLRLCEGINGPFRGLIGPWSHAYPWKAKPSPMINGLKDLCRWWDHWLKNIDTGLMEEPRLRVWMQDSVPPLTFYSERSGRWVSEASWPSPNIISERLYLNDGALGRKPKSERFIQHCSEVISGVTHGDWCPYGYEAEMPSDQREEDGRSLVFDLPALKRKMEILGAPTIKLDVSCNQPNAELYVRLCDVAPDGASTRVTYGVFNLTHRNGHEDPQTLERGKRYQVEVPMNNIAHVFPRGHRIRVTVQTAAWPLVWPSPKQATITVTTGLSSLDLPVRTKPNKEIRLPNLGMAVTAEPLEVVLSSAPHRSRTIHRDFVSGETEVKMVKSRGRYLMKDTQTEIAGDSIETYTIKDSTPLSARAQVDYSILIKREPKWDIHIRTCFILTATEQALNLTTHAEAYCKGTRVWAKSWEEKIMRNGI